MDSPLKSAGVFLSFHWACIITPLTAGDLLKESLSGHKNINSAHGVHQGGINTIKSGPLFGSLHPAVNFCISLATVIINLSGQASASAIKFLRQDEFHLVTSETITHNMSLFTPLGGVLMSIELQDL